MRRLISVDPNARSKDAAAMRRALIVAMEELGLASTSEAQGMENSSPRFASRRQ